MMQIFAKILAKNPPSILIVLGAALIILGNDFGIPMVFLGFILNLIWLLLRFR